MIAGEGRILACRKTGRRSAGWPGGVPGQALPGNAEILPGGVAPDGIGWRRVTGVHQGD